MHTLFVREHNRLAGEIKARFCSATDTEIYQLARKLVGATLQIITYREFLPALVGSAAPGIDSIFDSNVDPSISNEFSTVAYRVGHTMLSPQVQFRDENGLAVMNAVPLRDVFFNPGFFDNAAINVDYVIGGQIAQECQEIDVQIIDEVRDHLFADGCLDLASLNIQRGRDHGILGYNSLRKELGLGEVVDFSDITSNTGLQQKLQSVYASVDEVDAWIGGLCEDHAHGVVGELFETIIVDQFERLRDGDKYWFMNDPDVQDPRLNGFWRMQEVSLQRVIQDNTIHTGAANVFFV
jgi:peroxidase